MTTNKKKQHYVPRGYLKNWLVERECEPGRKSTGLWVYPVCGKIDGRFSTNVIDISQQRYFYRTHMDSVVFGLLLDKYRDADPLILEVVKSFSFLLDVAEVEKKSVKCAGVTEFAGKIYLEHRYENIEKAFQRTTDIIGISFDEYIRLLINGDYELYDLIGIYSVQLFRTKKMRGRYSEVMKTVYSSQEGGDPQKLTEVQRDSLIKCILFIDAISFTYDMTGTEFSIEFLRSMEGESFLTSNSPALHYSAHGESLTSLEDFEGFMPLTPKIALLIRGCKPTGNNLNVRGVFNHEVLQWNSKIILEADDEIYSTKEIDGAMLS